MWIPKGIIGVRVQPARRPCGNPWTKETYGGLEQGFTSPAEGVSDREFVQVKRKVCRETSVRVQPARRPCGNPWTEETYGGLEQGFTSPEDGVSDREFIQVKRKVCRETSARRSRGI
ncbi:hypothetical protein Taro_056362, partial [Colocasia esculenta]|nr:hypothetical protein [Colocasia esculenta]